MNYRMTLHQQAKKVQQYIGSVTLPFQGPDAERYLLMGSGEAAASPFNLRWLLPKICGGSQKRWWIVWWISLPVSILGCFWWGMAIGYGWAASLAAGVMLVSLSGITGVRPVEVSLPAMAISILSAAALSQGLWPVAIALSLVAGCIKETSPVWIALWTFNPIPLIGLIAPLIRRLVSKPNANDPVTDANPILIRVREDPVLSSLEHHRGMWRNGWVMVLPWGLTLAALYKPSVALVVLLVVSYAQLLVATDLSRLLHSSAGPAMALAAAHNLPSQWLLLLVVVQVMWWRPPAPL